MRTDEIQWENSDSPVTEEQIAAVETTLGIRFPDDYRKLIPSCHGGHPTPVDYVEAVGTGPDRMLSFNPQSSYYILDTVDALVFNEQLPVKVIPFAQDAGGAMMCFDFRADATNPKIIYWVDDVSEPEPVFYPLADSFSHFLEILVKDPDAEKFAPSKTE